VLAPQKPPSGGPETLPAAQTPFSPDIFEAILDTFFGHFGIILVFFSEAVFQHGFGTVFS
jgi:hypothetical protein